MKSRSAQNGAIIGNSLLGNVVGIWLLSSSLKDRSPLVDAYNGWNQMFAQYTQVGMLTCIFVSLSW